MAASVNKVILIGNLGNDPEVRKLDSGVTVVNFSMATSETYKDKNSNEKTTETQWHNIVLWRGLAEVAEKYLKKGSKIYIEGKLKTRSWEDQDGNKRYITEVVGDNMTMLGKAQSEVNAENNNESTPTPAKNNREEEDDLPF